MARLVDKFEELPGNKLDRELYEQRVVMQQDNFKSNRHRIKTLEIGQGNLKLTIRDLSKSVSNLNHQVLHAHIDLPPGRRHHL